MRLQPAIEDALRLRSTLPAIIAIEAAIDPAAPPPILWTTRRRSTVLMNLCTNAAPAHRGRRAHRRAEADEVDKERPSARPRTVEGATASSPSATPDTAWTPTPSSGSMSRSSRPRGRAMARARTGRGRGHHSRSRRRHRGGECAEAGTTFVLHFPEHEAAVLDGGPAASTWPRRRRSACAVRRRRAGLVRFLSASPIRLGYVVTRTDPIAALELFRAGPGDFDLDDRPDDAADDRARSGARALLGVARRADRSRLRLQRIMDPCGRPVPRPAISWPSRSPHRRSRPSSTDAEEMSFRLRATGFRKSACLKSRTS